jgi:hypothetical protein
MIHWALRGKQSTSENRENDISNIGLYIPSNSALKRLTMPHSIYNDFDPVFHVPTNRISGDDLSV